MNKVLLMFSGGQDSTTVLGWCLKKFHEVHLIIFDYGQKHLVEITAAKQIIQELKYNFAEWKGKIKSNYVYKINNLNSFNENSLTSNIDFKKKKRTTQYICTRKKYIILYFKCSLRL